jgi:hypothetical protein
MQVARPIEAGRLVIVSLKSNDGAKTYDLSAHVMHCRPAPFEEWYIGCELTMPITSDDLEHLL